MDSVLVDTSAWIEFFRKKEPYFTVVSDLINDDRVSCIGLILAELLQGAKSKKELDVLKEFLHVFDFLPESSELWQEAGELSFVLQRKGRKVGLSDCYIAVMTRTHEAGLLTLDKHFKEIKKVFPFTLTPIP
ncbi:MAG: PIN domain-containing protein [Thermodesulfovibrionia bacterium]|nr:PIN domain-containing protein [Thermodesulfovibrionia bacterium]